MTPAKIESMKACTDNRLRVGWLGLKDSVTNGIGWCLEKIGAPARLRAFEFVDPASDETLYLYTSKRYSVLCVGDRRFYFDRITGKFDGVSAPSDCVTGRLELSD
jgi:hypothetical protein